MRKKKLTSKRGFTIIELVVTMVISIIVIFGIGVVLADNQRGWNKMYNRVYADVVKDGYVARKMFDSVIRKAVGGSFLMNRTEKWIEIYYYANDASTAVDRYARFSFNNGLGQVELVQGDWNPANGQPRVVTSTQTVCSNVSSCMFNTNGQSAQMILTLDDGSQTVPVTASALMHNQ